MKRWSKNQPFSRSNEKVEPKTQKNPYKNIFERKTQPEVLLHFSLLREKVDNCVLKIYKKT
jgi:hypothetical protein